MKNTPIRAAFAGLLYASLLLVQGRAVEDPKPRSLEESGQMLKERMEKHQQAYATQLAALTQKMKDEQDNNQKGQDDAGKSDTKIDGHFEDRLLEYVLSLPEVTSHDQTISFDVPVVKFEDKNVSLNVPVIVFRTVPGPDISYPSLEWRNDGIFGTPSPTYHTIVQHTSYDVPNLENRLQNYFINVPVSVGTQRAEITIKVPEVTMKTQRVSFNFPVFVADHVQLGSPDAKKQKELGDKSMQQKDDNDAAMKATTAKFNMAMKSEMTWYAPWLLSYTEDAAVGSIAEQAKVASGALLKAYGDDNALVQQKVPPGDPRRVTTQTEINKYEFMLGAYTTSGNSAIFNAYKSTRERLVAQVATMGMSEAELAAALDAALLGGPGVVDYKVHISPDHKVIYGR